MSTKLKTIAAVLATFTLAAVGLTGCSGGKSDAAACNAFDKAFAEAQGTDDFEKAAKLLNEGVQKAADHTDNAELAAQMLAAGNDFGDILSDQADESRFFDLSINMLKMSETCAAAGAPMKAVDETIELMGLNVFTIEELEELSRLEAEYGDELSDLDEDDFDWDMDEGTDDDSAAVTFDFDKIDEELVEFDNRRVYYEDCAAGDMRQCDQLYSRMPDGTELSKFGYYCGGAPKTEIWCSETWRTDD